MLGSIQRTKNRMMLKTELWSPLDIHSWGRNRQQQSKTGDYKWRQLVMWKKMNLGRRTKNGEVHWWHFAQGPSPEVFLLRTLAPMLHLYVKLWCLHFQMISLCQDKSSSRTGQRWGFYSLLCLSVKNLKTRFLKFCPISFMGISCSITIHQRGNPLNQSAGVTLWLHRQECEWWGHLPPE